MKRILYFFRNPHWPFKFFKDLLSPVAKVAGIALAPFTGGASLAVTGALTSIEQIDAQKKAQQQRDEQLRLQQQQAAAQTASQSGRILDPGTIASNAPVGTAPVIVQVPTPMLPAQQGPQTQTLLLIGGAVLVGVLVLRR